MRAEARRWTAVKGWEGEGKLGEQANLVMVFADVGDAREACLKEVRTDYPRALVVGCSSAGEIWNTEVQTQSLSLIAMAFDQTRVVGAFVAVREHATGEALGRALGGKLEHKGLVHALVISDGMTVDGAGLARGIRAVLPEGVAVTGGLAGDADRFRETWVCCGEVCGPGLVVIVGLYGEGLKVGHGSQGGWDHFGLPMIITRAEGTELYELDGKPALDVYERYLGAYATGLPATGLLFPFSVEVGEGRTLVRSILGVDRDKRSLTFAGEMPVGAKAQLMKAHFEHLMSGATGAARDAMLGDHQAEAALLISCVGRRLVLKTRVAEEVAAVRRVVGPQAAMAGFYSYGEIAPSAPHAGCELHNQTMTITTFREG